jgi:hypothetical protein
MPEGRIQILTHRTENLVWQPRWLTHPNGALGLLSLVIAVSDVEEAAQRFIRFTARPARPSSQGRTIELDRGRLHLVTARAFTQMLPEAPIPSLPFAGAYGIKVKSLATLQELLTRGGVTTRRREHDLVAIFPDELGHGAWLFAEDES